MRRCDAADMAGRRASGRWVLAKATAVVTFRSSWLGLCSCCVVALFQKWRDL